MKNSRTCEVREHWRASINQSGVKRPYKQIILLQFKLISTCTFLSEKKLSAAIFYIKEMFASAYGNANVL